jgi:hypothetical protein
MYDDFSKVICLGNLKQAALYYDHVIPLLLKDIPGFEYLDNKNAIGKDIDLGKKVIESLLVSDESHAVQDLVYLAGHKRDGVFSYPFINSSYRDIINTESASEIGAYNFYKTDSRSKMRDQPIIGFGLGGGNLGLRLIKHNEVSIRGILDKFIEEYKISSANILFPQSLVNTSPSNDIFLSLSSLPLIDTEKSTWEQIIEIRKDEKSKNNLKQMRVFLSTNYEGKSKAFIEDDLNIRLMKHRDAVDAHGLETKLTCLSTLANSKNIITTSSVAMMAILLGEPGLSTVTLMTGVCLEVANISIEIAKGKFNLTKIRRDHELAYVFDTNETLKTNSKKHVIIQ